MTWSVESCAQRVEAGERIGPDDARDLLTAARRDPWSVWLAADRVRRRFRGRSVHLCSIAAVRVGNFAMAELRYRAGFPMEMLDK